MAGSHILSIDQGTTSTRALLFDRGGVPQAVAQKELRQFYPAHGQVEHDPEEIWQATLAVCREVIAKAGGAEEVAAIGITNQRETTLLWDRATGMPLHKAIVWQDRRTAPLCETLKGEGREEAIRKKTGLLIDPYFSATKLAWLLDTHDPERTRAHAGDLAFGTVDSWLIWKLTGGKAHVTDATNAARTMLFNIHSGEWDREIQGWFGVPDALLPEVKDCCADFGTSDPELFGVPIPIAGVAGDQQAATVGQACFEPGLMKSTYGTGCFALLNTGERAVLSDNRLLTTIAYQLGGARTYAIEGSIFMAGAIVQWIRDELGLIATAAESEALAAAARADSEVVLVPAFTGLGAPYWRPDVNAALFGMSRDTGRAEIVRAAIESVSLQTRDLMLAMAEDVAAAGLSSPQALRVDGGMVANDWFVQNLADILGRPVERPEVTETTALGAAYLAGLQAGFFDGLDDIAARWRVDAEFRPVMTGGERDGRYARWTKGVQRLLKD